MTISVEGTQVAAHASKQAAVSYPRAGEMRQQLGRAVEPLLAKAERADAPCGRAAAGGGIDDSGRDRAAAGA